MTNTWLYAPSNIEATCLRSIL